MNKWKEVNLYIVEFNFRWVHNKCKNHCSSYAIGALRLLKPVICKYILGKPTEIDKWKCSMKYFAQIKSFIRNNILKFASKSGSCLCRLQISENKKRLCITQENCSNFFVLCVFIGSELNITLNKFSYMINLHTMLCKSKVNLLWRCLMA